MLKEKRAAVGNGIKHTIQWKGEKMVFTAEYVVISPIRKMSFDAPSTDSFCPISFVSLAVKCIVFYIFYL